MKIDIPDSLVDDIVIRELQWAYEHTYNQDPDDNDLPLRQALRECLSYFMPVHAANAYFQIVEKKHER